MSIVLANDVPLASFIACIAVCDITHVSKHGCWRCAIADCAWNNCFCGVFKLMGSSLNDVRTCTEYA